MLSGGVDSTYTLIKLLKETNHTILVHHIHLVNNEERFEIEAQRVLSIIELCRKLYRPFLYSETLIDHSNMPFFGYDIISVGFEAGIVAHSYETAYKSKVSGWTVGTCSEEGHLKKRFVYAKAACQANCFPKKAPDFFLFPPIPKYEQIQYLPKEIVNHCWTCRRPVQTKQGVKECGRCKTCKLMKSIC